MHEALVESAGVPPFTVTLGDKAEEAPSFEALRNAVLEVVRSSRASALNRFKGLGEMNAEQLRETTMDPETRTLQQVSIEDAAEAEQLFSKLMGEVVEYRRRVHRRQRARGADRRLMPAREQPRKEVA